MSMEHYFLVEYLETALDALIVLWVFLLQRRIWRLEGGKKVVLRGKLPIVARRSAPVMRKGKLPAILLGLLLGSSALAQPPSNIPIIPACPAGSGTELQARQGDKKCQPVTGSSVTGTAVALGGILTIPNLALVEQATPATPPADTAYLYAKDRLGRTAISYLAPSGVEVSLAQDNILSMRNETGLTIPAFRVVYEAGTGAGGEPLMALADADDQATMPAVGVTLAAVPNLSNGTVMFSGVLTGVPTLGFLVGDILYVSQTPGLLTTAAPPHPALRQRIVRVLSVHATEGTALVSNVGVRGDHEGTNLDTWKVGTGAGAGPATVEFKNANTGSLSWTPTGAHALTLPAETGTLCSTGSVCSGYAPTNKISAGLARMEMFSAGNYGEFQGTQMDFYATTGAFLGDFWLRTSVTPPLIYMEGRWDIAVTPNAASGNEFFSVELTPTANTGSAIIFNKNQMGSTTAHMTAYDGSGDSIFEYSLGSAGTRHVLGGDENTPYEMQGTLRMKARTPGPGAAGDTPPLFFTPEAGAEYRLFVENTTDDFRFTTNTTTTENVEFENEGTGVADVYVETTDGVLTSVKDAAVLTTGTLDVARIASAALANVKLANMAANTVKANPTASPAAPSDLAVNASTVVGRGAAGNIVAAQLETSQVADNAITYAKAQDVSATDRVLGRISAGAGDPQEVTFSDAAQDFSQDTFADNQVWIADSATGGTPRAIPECSLATKIQYTNTTNNFTCVPDQTGGGGSDPIPEATYTFAGAGATMVSNAVMLDVWNDTGSGVVLRVNEVFCWARNSAAVTGINAPCEVFRSAAAGTGGTTLTAGRFDTADATLPAQVTSRNAPTGGAGAAGQIIAGSRIDTEEASTSTATRIMAPWFQSQSPLYVNHGDTTRKRWVIREGEGILCRWGLVVGTPAGVGACMVTLQTGSVGAKEVPTYNWTSDSAATGNKTLLDIWNGTGSGKVLKIVKIQAFARPAAAGVGTIISLEAVRTSSIGTGGTTRIAGESDSADAAVPAQITARDAPTGGAATLGSPLIADTTGTDEISTSEFRAGWRLAGGTGHNTQYVYDGSTTRRPITIRENEGFAIKTGPLSGALNVVVIVEGTLE